MSDGECEVGDCLEYGSEMLGVFVSLKGRRGRLCSLASEAHPNTVCKLNPNGVSARKCSYCSPHIVLTSKPVAPISKAPGGEAWAPPVPFVSASQVPSLWSLGSSPPNSG